MNEDGGITVAKVPGGLALTLLVGAAALAYVVRDHLTTPYDDAFESAGKAHGVPPNLLRAIARVESGMRPAARNPATGFYANGSYDVGLMQINTLTGSKLGYNVAQLMAPATSIEAAARVLEANARTLGTKLSPWTWPASYNVGPDLTPWDVGLAYAGRVLTHWQLYDFGRSLA